MKPYYKLRSWITNGNIDKFNFMQKDPYETFISNIKETNYELLRKYLIENFTDHRPDAIGILYQYEIDFNLLCFDTETEAVNLIFELAEKFPEIIDKSYLSVNSNNRVVEYVLNNKIIYTNFFSGNTNDKAVEYLLQNTNDINMFYFIQNPNDKAVDYLLQNITKIGKAYIRFLSLNPNPKVIDFLEKNREYIYYPELYKNPGIYILNYQAMRENMSKLKKELMSVSMHPSRVEKIMKLEEQRLGRELTDLDLDRIL